MSRRLVLAFAEAEPWKIDHQRAMLCRDIEDDMAWGIRLMSGLAEEEATFQALVLAGGPAGDIEAGMAGIDECRRVLVEVCEKILETAESLRRDRDAIDGIEEFRAAIEEARHRVEAAEFEQELPPLETMRPLLRPENPRPERYGD
jgi:hypothetical protein